MSTSEARASRPADRELPEEAANAPAYYRKLRPERARALYRRIVKQLTSERRYRNIDYSARQLAEDLETNTRYVAAAIALCTGNNYSTLVNSLRVRYACRLLGSLDPRVQSMTIEEIGMLSGFASRQAFYKAFHRIYALTPQAYRRQATAAAELEAATTAE